MLITDAGAGTGQNLTSLRKVLAECPHIFVVRLCIGFTKRTVCRNDAGLLDKSARSFHRFLVKTEYHRD